MKSKGGMNNTTPQGTTATNNRRSQYSTPSTTPSRQQQQQQQTVRTVPRSSRISSSSTQLNPRGGSNFIRSMATPVSSARSVPPSGTTPSSFFGSSSSLHKQQRWGSNHSSSTTGGIHNNNNPMALPDYEDANSRNLARRQSLMEAISVVQSAHQGAWDGIMEDSSIPNNHNHNKNNHNHNHNTIHNNSNMSSSETNLYSNPQNQPSSLLQTTSPLDNFNLLGVVTTPARMMDVKSSPPKRANDSNNNDSNTTNTIPPPPTTSSYETTLASLTAALTDTEYLYSTLPSTLSHSLDSLNATIHSYSTTILGSNYILDDSHGGGSGGGGGAPSLDFKGSDLGYEDVPVHQLELENLPEEIVSLDLGGVEGHLRVSGGLVVRFGWREGESEMVLVGEGDGVVGNNNGSGEEDGMEVDDDGNAIISDEKGEKGGIPPESTSLDQEEEQEGEEEEEEGEEDEERKKEREREDDPTSSVPEIFFNPQFDLTDPKTFESLLVFDVDDDEEEEQAKDEEQIDTNTQPPPPTPTPTSSSSLSSSKNPNNITNRHPNQRTTPNRQPAPQLLTSPVHIPKPPPAKLTQDLDIIELALLNQVRSKSDSFFRETNRFSYLKSLVNESVEQVQALRSHLRAIRERSIDNVELIPIMDRKRGDMRKLEGILEEILDVVEVKGSVAGLIAAGDYLGAVEAIYMARTLLNGDGFVRGDGDKDEDLNGTEGDDEMNGELLQDDTTGTADATTTTTTTTTSTTSEPGPKRYVLGKIVALSKVSDQLAQFENLVVMDLSTELIEILLTWDANGPMSPSFSNSSFFPDIDAATAAAASANTNGSSSSSSPPNNSKNHNNGTSALANSTTSISLRSERRIKVKHTVKALQKCEQLSSVADAYREKLCDTIRVTVRTTVSECAADAAKDTTLLSSPTDTNASTSTAGGASKNGTEQQQPKSSITEGIVSMTFEQFMECMNMIFEQVLALLQSAAGVSKFFREEGISLKDGPDMGAGNQRSDRTLSKDASISKRTNRHMPRSQTEMASSTSPSAVFSASDLSHKSITELLRLRKEAHSLVSFDEMKRLWDSCLAFTLQVEKFSGQKAYGLRSTLLAQAKAFVERRHEGNMSSLVATLDGERWTQCDVSSERQATLHRLCSGRAVLPSFRTSSIASSNATNNTISTPAQNDTPYVIIEGKRFRAVWSCLLLVEMIMHNVSCAAHFQTLATNAVSKTTELLRRFNSRATQLVLGAGAIHSAARLKSINAKHLALVTQCVGIVLAILPHVRAALMAQLPSKQHGLLSELDKIKKEYLDHSEMVLSKFVTIIGGIVEHGLAPRIPKIHFDKRAKSLGAVSQRHQQQQQAAALSKTGNGNTSTSDSRPARVPVACCPFLEGVNTNTKKMHQVLLSNLPAEDLTDVFSRIFAYLDSNIPKLFIKSDADDANPFKFPITEEGKCRMIMEVEEMSITLNSLSNVRPWDFEAMKFLERRLDVLYYADDNAVASAPIEVTENKKAPPGEEKGNEQALGNSAKVKPLERDGESSENQAEEGEEDKKREKSHPQHSDRVEAALPMNGDHKVGTKEQHKKELEDLQDVTSSTASSAVINVAEHKRNNSTAVQDICSNKLPSSECTQSTIENQQGFVTNVVVVSGIASGANTVACDDNGHKKQASVKPSHVAPEDKREGQ